MKNKCFQLLPWVPAAALLAGATATAQDFQARMGEPLHGLSASDLVLFEMGKTAFNANLSQAEGLGPVFNDTGCGACHGTPAAGGFSTTVVTRFGAQGPPFDPLANLGGSLLQSQAIDIMCEEMVPPQADVMTFRITPHTFGAGLAQRVPDSDLMDLESNPPSNDVSGIAHMVQLVENLSLIHI